MEKLAERRVSLTLAFAIIAVAIVHRHGWFDKGFAWVKAPAASASPATPATQTQSPPPFARDRFAGSSSQPTAPNVSQP